MWAVEGEDFEEQTLILTFLDGERERKVSVLILDDDEPEGQEFFYVFLTDPQGGAQIVRGKGNAGFAAFATVIIAGNLWLMKIKCILLLFRICNKISLS
jgi:G-protein coupled receptor 98